MNIFSSKLKLGFIAAFLSLALISFYLNSKNQNLEVELQDTETNLQVQYKINEKTINAYENSIVFLEKKAFNEGLSKASSLEIKQLKKEFYKLNKSIKGLKYESKKHNRTTVLFNSN